MVLHASRAFVTTCFTCLLTCYVHTYVPTHVTDVPYVNACLRAFVSYVPSFFPFFFKCLPFIKCFTPLHFFASLRILRAFSFLRALRFLIFLRASFVFIFLRALRVFIFLSVSNFSLYVLRDYFKAEYILHNMQYIIINNMTSRKYSTKPTFERGIL